MMNNKRPLEVLRYNAEIMRDNGAPKEVISKYLSDNGTSFSQILSIKAPDDSQLERALASEKDGSFIAQRDKFNESMAKIQKDDEKERFLKNVQGDVRSIAQGLMFGGGDEFESAITGQPVEQIRQEQKQFEKQNPVKSTILNIGGAIANPLGAIGAGAKGTLLGSKAAFNIAKGAALGAGYGGAYGFGSGEGGVGNRLENMLRSAKTGAVIGGAIPVAVEGIKTAGKIGADIVGQASGAGGATLRRAYDAGTRNSQTFKNAMRKTSGVYDVVDDVDKAVRSLEKARGEAFKAALPKDANLIKLNDSAVTNAFKEATNKISGITAGVDDTAAKALGKVETLLKNVKYSGGLTFENAMEVKKAIDGIIEPLSRAGEKNAIRIIQPVQNALKDTMIEAGPQYANALKEFSKASKIIDALKGAFTSKDPTTELRKLQGMTRQSVAAAQGGKQELGKILDKVSGGKILDAIAGGQVTEIIPRDPLRALAAGASAFGAKALSANPFSPLMLTAFSPRLSGEVVFKLGQIASKIPQVSSGRVTNATTQQLLKALGK